MVSPSSYVYVIVDDTFVYLELEDEFVRNVHVHFIPRSQLHAAGALLIDDLHNDYQQNYGISNK